MHTFPNAVLHTIAVHNIKSAIRHFPTIAPICPTSYCSPRTLRPICSTFMGIVANFVLRVSVLISIDNSPYKALSDGHKLWDKYDCIRATLTYSHHLLRLATPVFTHMSSRSADSGPRTSYKMRKVSISTFNKWKTQLE